MCADSSVNNALWPPGDLKIGTIMGNTIRDYSSGVFSLLLRCRAVARLAWGFAVRHEAAPGSRVSPFHHNTANAVTRAVSSAVRSSGSLQMVCAFPAVVGFPLPAPLQLQSRSQKSEASLSAFSSIFFTFPLLSILPLPGHPAFGRREGAICPNPHSDARRAG